MEHKMIPLSQLSPRQIMALAGLHHGTMHSLLSDLGLPIVERYYQYACKEPAVIGFCALSETGNLLGWVLGSPKPDQLNGRLREDRLWFVTQMLRVLFTHPRLIWQMILSLRFAAVPIAKDVVELTYMGVDTSARGQGLGSELIKAFVHAARDLQYRAVVLSVEVENKSAIALYTRVGFQISNSHQEGSFNRHRMELRL